MTVPDHRTGLSPSEQRRAGQLKAAKRRATGLLVAVTIVFALSTALVSTYGWLSWVQATAVASMVGALADWFAVTALFRRPLGLPIPHTAVIVERKDRFAETLGSFVQESFLTPEAVLDRLHSAHALERVAAWMAEPEHASDVSARLARALVAGSDLLRDDEVQAALLTVGRRRLESTPVAPIAGRLLEQLIKDGRHEPVIDAALVGLNHYLGVHGASLKDRLGVEAPWWVPAPLEQRVAERVLQRTRSTLAEMSASRSHPLRRQLDAGLVKFAHDLRHSPELLARGEELKADLLNQPQLREFSASVWTGAKEELRRQAELPDSELRRRATTWITETGGRLLTDEATVATANRAIDATVRTILGRLDTEAARLVSGTISRWDATETSRRLELLLGPDLQYIRINGTVIGAAAGLALHAVAVLAQH